MTLASRRRDSLADGAFLLILTFSIFAFGAVHRWASAITEIGIWWLAAILLIASPSRFRGLGILGVTTLLLFAYLAGQCVPLPAWLLDSLTPVTARYYERTVAAIPAAEGVSTLPAASVASTDWRPIAIDPFAARSELLRYLAYALALAIASGVSRPRRFFQALVWVGVGVAIFALIQGATWNGYVLWFFAPYETGPRPLLARLTGPFVNPDHFALLLELVLPAAAALLATFMARIMRRRRMRRATADLLIPSSLLAVGTAVLIAALVGTASRGGIVGGMLGLLVAASGAAQGRTAELGRRVERTGRWTAISRWANRLVPLGVAAAIVLSGFLYAGSKIRSEVGTRFAQTVSNPDLGYRTELWHQALGVVEDFPLVGVGLQGWGDVYPRYRRFPLLVVPIRHAHNDYVEWLAEVGAIGVGLTILSIVGYVTWVWTNRALPRALFAGFVGALLAIGWHEFFDFGLRVPANALLLALLLGLLGNRHWQTEEASDRARRTRSRPLPYWKAIFHFRSRKRRRGVEPQARSEANARQREIVVDGASSERPPLRMLPRSMVLVAAAGLTIASVRQFREFLAWNAARHGSFSVAFAAEDATTWAEAASRLGNADDASRKAMYRQAIRLRPAYDRAYREWAGLETDSSAKLRILESGIYANPVAVDLRLALADLVDRLGRSSEALVEIETAAYTVPVASEHPYLRKGNAGLNPAVTEAADRGFQRAIAERPKDSALRNELALSYAARESWLEAARTWMKAGELDGDWASFGWPTGESFARAGSYAAAEEPLRKAIAAAPDEGLNYWTLAISSLLPQAKYEEAEAVLERALRRPLRQALEHRRQRMILYEALARVRWQANDRRRAIEALSEATRADPREPVLQFELGVAYMETQSYDLARMAFGRAMALDPSNLSYRAAFDQAVAAAAKQ